MSLTTVLKLPLDVALADIELNQLPGINQRFQTSPFTFVTKEKQEEQLDEKVKKSQEVRINQQVLTQASNVILRKYLKSLGEEEFAQTTDLWRVFKYNNGHFVEHMDLKAPKQDYVHIGAAVWLPPTTLCKYSGGVLQVKDGMDNRQILPHQTKWTHVIIPMGALHSVSQVEGTRISYVNPYLYIHQKEGKTYEFPEQVVNYIGVSLVN